MRYRLTPAAAHDLEAILQETLQQFGPHQVEHYAGLIEGAIRILVADPQHIASRLREDLLPALRSFHVERAATRRGAAAHLIYYRIEPDGTLTILRLLHQSMDPSRHFD